MPILNDNTFSIKLALIDDKPKKTLKQKLTERKSQNVKFMTSKKLIGQN